MSSAKEFVNPLAILMQNRAKNDFNHNDPLPENPKAFLEHFIRTNSEHIQLVPRSSKSVRNELWNHYSVIAWKGEETKHALCLKCLNGHAKKISVYSFAGGISSMSRHSSDAHSEKPSPASSLSASVLSAKSNQFDFPLSYLRPKNLSTANKARLVDAAAKVSILDLRPFNYFQGEGMKLFLSELQEIIVNQGKIIPSELSVNRKTVRRRVLSIQQESEEKVKKFLASVPSVSLVADHWTDRYGKEVYLGVACSSANLQTGYVSVLTLGILSVPNQTTKTTMEVLQELKYRFGIEDKVSVPVTDNCAALMKAFDYDVVRCAGHNLNLVLLHGYLKFVVPKREAQVDEPDLFSLNIESNDNPNEDEDTSEIDEFLEDFDRECFADESDEEDSEVTDFVELKHGKRALQPSASSAKSNKRKRKEIPTAYKKHQILIVNCKRLVN